MNGDNRQVCLCIENEYKMLVLASQSHYTWRSIRRNYSSVLGENQDWEWMMKEPTTFLKSLLKCYSCYRTKHYGAVLLPSFAFYNHYYLKGRHRRDRRKKNQDNPRLPSNQIQATTTKEHGTEKPANSKQTTNFSCLLLSLTNRENRPKNHRNSFRSNHHLLFSLSLVLSWLYDVDFYCHRRDHYPLRNRSYRYLSSSVGLDGSLCSEWGWYK